MPMDTILIGGFPVRIGTQVRLRPRGVRDMIDPRWNGKIAMVVSIQRDFQGGIHFGVILEDAKAPFYFGPSEIEVYEERTGAAIESISRTNGWSGR